MKQEKMRQNLLYKKQNPYSKDSIVYLEIFDILFKLYRFRRHLINFYNKILQDK